MTPLFGQPQSDFDQSWFFVRIALERGMDRVKSARGAAGGGAGGALTYRCESPLPIGRRVEVTLGRGAVAAAGIVGESGGAELAAGLDPGRIKPIVRDTGAGLPVRLVELARWMAVYYVCPLGMVLSTMMPAAVKKGTGTRTRLTYERTGAKGEDLKPKARALVETLIGIDAAHFPITPEDLATRLTIKTLAPLKRLEALGVLRRIETEQVTEFGGATQSTLAASFDAAAERRPELTVQQARIVEGIGTSISIFGVHLLRGVTGSGKTEVYLRLIERVLADDARATALVLVPEISLTPQTAGRFTARFRALGPNAVAVLHSGLTASQRHKQWMRAGNHQGGARVVVGARSAVFAPLEHVKLIVVDEEHAGDYKQDQLPRYHGRDVAIKRGQIEGCPVVLGSATPSLESWANTRQSASLPPSSAKYKLWELTERVGGGVLPPVEVVDLSEERRLMRKLRPDRDPWADLIGPRLEGAMHETFSAGGQALILLNRRGYSAYIACPDTICGYRLTCDDCDVLMVHHRWISGGGGGSGDEPVRPRREVVRCHHCLAQKLMPDGCPVCGKRLIRLGMGTQRLEEEVCEKFPELTSSPPTPPSFLRVDGDTTASAREWFSVLSRFAHGELRLLLGTQMIAKGLDFPNVRLVGVINADSAMNLADFRATERTFQLVSQVAGRAGRGLHHGRVIVQTMDPASPAIRFAAKHDYLGFAEAELLIRQNAGLPPITRMARIVLRDQDLAKATLAAERLRAIIDAECALLAPNLRNAIRIVGPMPAPIARIATFHRLTIELTATRRTLLQDLLASIRAKGWIKSDAHTAVDIDPVALT